MELVSRARAQISTFRTRFKRRLKTARSVPTARNDLQAFPLASISPAHTAARPQDLNQVSYFEENDDEDENEHSNGNVSGIHDEINDYEIELSSIFSESQPPSNIEDEISDPGTPSIRDLIDDLLARPSLPCWTHSEFWELHGRCEVNNYPRFYFFGDTLTDRGFWDDELGFGTLLRDKYKGKVEIVNRGFAAHNSTWLRDEFQEYVIKVAEKRGPPAPLLIAIWFGFEDSRLPPLPIHIPLVEFEMNLRHYVDTILEHPNMHSTKIILITPPPINVESVTRGLLPPLPGFAWLHDEAMETRAHKTWLARRLYAETVVEVAQEYEDTMQVGVIDLWRGITQLACGDGLPGDFDYLDRKHTLPGCGLPGAAELGEDILQGDMFLGEKANELLVSELLHLIRGKWPEISPELHPLSREVPGTRNGIPFSRRRRTVA